jgi:S1-C subfamily serine protease
MRAALLATALLASSAVRAEEDPLRRIEQAQTRLFDEAAPSVVFIAAGDGFGSGFVVAPGLVLTSAHVVRDDRVNLVSLDGRKLRGRVVERAAGADLALVEAEGLPRPLALELAAPRVGAFVAAIAHGRGGVWSLNVGIVSNLYPDRAGDAHAILQTQIPLAPGASGGPVLDRQGRVVGIVTAGIVDAPGINFAIRAEVATRTLARLRALGTTLTVRAAPQAQVFLDGVYAGTGPTLTLGASTGPHVLTATTAGAALVRRRIQFPAEREVDLVPRPLRSKE